MLMLMLVAVEGGSFFSASSSGYRKGLTLLLSRDRLMRVVPLNHYQLLVVDKDHPFIQLDSIKNRVFRGCASFTCFSCGGASAGLDTTTPCPPLKVEPVKHPVVSSSPPESIAAVDTTTTTTTPCPVKVDSLQHPVVPESIAVPENGKDHDANKADNNDDTNKEASFKVSLRSSLKRPPSVVESRSLEGIKEHETLSSVDDASELTNGDDTGRRKVQWPDANGSELTQVREFEPSEMGLSDEEWGTGRQRTCSCVIM